MPNVVFTANSTPQNAPFGAIDTHYTQIEDLQIRQGVPDFNYSEDDPGALGPDAADLSIMLFRAQYAHQIPSNAINIQCRLYGYTGGGFGSFDAESRQVLKRWDKIGATYNSQTTDIAWDTAGAQAVTDRGSATDTETIDAGGVWEVWEIDAVGASWVSNPRNNNGVGVFPVQPNTGFRFMDKSSGTDGQRPEIHFAYEIPAGGGDGRGLVAPLQKILRPVVRKLIEATGAGGGANPVPTPTVLKIFVWGHSLFNHAIGTFNAFTNTGWSMCDMSRQSFNYIGIKQIFNQLRDQVLPPPQANQIPTTTNQFDPWPASPAAAWPTVGWDYALIMASNFEQVTKTPAAFATESDPVLAYADTNSPSTQIIIYEHWSQPAQYGYTVGAGPTMAEPDWTNFKNIHRNGGAYHVWHIDYQDAIIANGYTDVRMIPVGPIIFDGLQTESYLSSLGFGDLFVDADPHPTATMSFMAASICYIALMGAPNGDFEITQEGFVNSAVADNLADWFTFVQSRLAFYGANSVNLPS